MPFFFSSNFSKAFEVFAACDDPRQTLRKMWMKRSLMRKLECQCDVLRAFMYCDFVIDFQKVDCLWWSTETLRMNFIE